MRKIVLTVVITLAVPADGLFAFLHLGLADVRADQPVPRWERALAMPSMDASTERHAPRLANPIPATAANLAAGASLYRDKCADCHGRPDNPVSDYGRSFYPPAPQFFRFAPDMPEYQNFYIIKHGVRWTAMPAWGHIMADSEMWQVAAVLSRIHDLPPAAQQELNKPGP